MNLGEKESVCSCCLSPQRAHFRSLSTRITSPVSPTETHRISSASEAAGIERVPLTDITQIYWSSEEDVSYQREAEQVHVRRSVPQTMEPSGDEPLGCTNTFTC